MGAEASDRVQEIRSRVVTERALISALDGKLPRAPYLRKRLQHAAFLLDDVENYLLPSALKAQPAYVAMWIDLAQFNLCTAAQERQKVQEIYDTYGPNILEIGGE